ncbi:hypothetical protein J1605_014415 [Eschrichtius robustus]|uniref:Uncharacterized protein n=1 Tax=Eschrichtius robustus TaxID=9764 RepID=A0AB34GG64_ESCRO|nr:hypothetical protein J1605_014415 [Eschrichtius robustus]
MQFYRGRVFQEKSHHPRPAPHLALWARAHSRRPPSHPAAPIVRPSSFGPAARPGSTVLAAGSRTYRPAAALALRVATSESTAATVTLAGVRLRAAGAVGRGSSLEAALIITVVSSPLPVS